MLVKVLTIGLVYSASMVVGGSALGRWFKQLKEGLDRQYLGDNR